MQWLSGLLALVVVTAVAPLGPIAAAQEQRRPPSDLPSPGKDASSPRKPRPATPATPRSDPSSVRKPAEQPRPLITFKDGRLTVQVQNRPLEWVLEEISRRVHVAIVKAAGVGGERISLQIKNLPLDDALRHILVEHDTFFFYGVEKDGPASLRVVWVYPRGKGRGIVPVPPESWASTAELERRLGDPDPAVRAQSLAGLIERRRDQAVEEVLRGLGDWNEQVRTQALYGALNAGVTIPPETLGQMALGDPSANVRFLALEALGGDPNAGAIAQQALNDPNPQVQQKAREIIRRLEAPTRSLERRESLQNQPRPRGQ